MLRGGGGHRYRRTTLGMKVIVVDDTGVGLVVIVIVERHWGVGVVIVIIAQHWGWRSLSWTTLVLGVVVG